MFKQRCVVLCVTPRYVAIINSYWLTLSMTIFRTLVSYVGQRFRTWIASLVSSPAGMQRVPLSRKLFLAKSTIFKMLLGEDWKGAYPLNLRVCIRRQLPRFVT